MFFFANYILLQCDIQPFAEYAVAPHVGAWIETQKLYTETLQKLESHPMWVRGLKHVKLCESKLKFVSHPMWVRGLKHSVVERNKVATSRTPCGCVD